MKSRQQHASGVEPFQREGAVRPPRSARFRLWAGACALCLVLVLALEAYSVSRATQDLVRENARMELGYRAGTALEQILADTGYAEAAQRGYLVTGEPDFLNSYDAATQALKRGLAAREILVRDDPAEASRHREVRAAAQQRLAHLGRGIALRQDELAWYTLGREEIDAYMRADRVAMDRLRQLVAAMQAAEAQTMAERQAGAERAAHEARLATLVPAVAALLLVFAVFYLLARDDAQRRRADAASKAERERLLAEERVARMDAQEASRAKDEFLSTVSHELRTPLQGVMGWIEVLKRPQSSDEQRLHAIERIEHNARSQVRIVEDLLDAARMLSGKLKLRLTQVDVEEVIGDAADICRPAAQAKGIDFRQNVVERGLRLVCDRDRLQQIVVNLLSNAVKFTPQGGSVSLTLRRDQSQIEIEVKDSGIGIAPELLERIFDRYIQASTSSARRYGGLGLGLSIVRHLAELHGGTATAASEGEGKGATFIVRLPISAAAVAQPAEATAGAAGGEHGAQVAGPIAGLRILVVDDEADTRELLTVLLAAEGAMVEAAGSAQQALARLGETRFEIVVSDIGMPEEDGYALLRQLRAVSAESSATPPSVPAIALSAFAGFQDRRRALEAGFDAQLAKPVALSELVEALARAAGRSGLGH